ncbi:CocE/NonD family hydrolase [Chloroflexota bacterium]
MVTTTEWEGGFDRPWHENHDIVLRWYDYWLKGIDTGLMDEPPVKLWVQGINQWRYEQEWPLARAEWTKLYLRQDGLLAETPPTWNEGSSSFVNVPWPRMGDKAPCVKYTTKPVTEDVEVTGPIALYFHASLSGEDANWMVDIKDIAPDGSETVISKGWLKASHRELDENKSVPYRPYHPHTRSIPIVPGRVYEYAIDIRDTSNVFKTGHRLQLVIKGQDAPWDDFFIWFHVNTMKEVRHTIHHTPEYPSYLLLPVIPKS